MYNCKKANFLSFFLSGGSSVGRASAFQAECREFESLPPLQSHFVLKDFEPELA